jgi:hypothetical protein
MPEVSENAMFLITASYQPFTRIEYGNKYTIPCDMLTTLVFLGFYIEATLDYIITEMEQKDEMIDVIGHKKGLGYKLFWFYNRNVTHITFNDLKEFRGAFNLGLLYDKFIDLKKILDFRNDIAHGDIDEAIKRIKDYKEDIDAVSLLRTSAKRITNKLVCIAYDAGFPHIEKNVDYDEAVGVFTSKENNS